MLVAAAAALQIYASGRTVVWSAGGCVRAAFTVPSVSAAAEPETPDTGRVILDAQLCHFQPTLVRQRPL